MLVIWLVRPLGGPSAVSLARWFFRGSQILALASSADKSRGFLARRYNKSRLEPLVPQKWQNPPNWNMCVSALAPQVVAPNKKEFEAYFAPFVGSLVTDSFHRNIPGSVFVLTGVLGGNGLWHEFYLLDLIKQTKKTQPWQTGQYSPFYILQLP